MADIASITGVSNVISNIRRKSAEMARGVERGLKLAGMRLQRESQKLVPVDTGNLKASAFTRAIGKGWDAKVNVGYTASYALFVHEAVGMVLKGQARSNGRGRYWDPQGRAQAKFLEEPARRLKDELRKIIRDNAKI